MASKKTLDLLKQRIICAEGKEDFDLFYKKYYDEIKKDLEVLECFKKLFEGENLDDWIEFDFSQNIPYINKIKEWL